MNAGFCTKGMVENTKGGEESVMLKFCHEIGIKNSMAMHGCTLT